MSGEKGLSVYYPLPLSLVPALPFISSSFWGEGPLGYGGLSGGGGTFFTVETSGDIIIDMSTSSAPGWKAILTNST